MQNPKTIILLALISTAMFGALAAQGQAVFNGTWRADLSKAKFSPKPFISYTSQGWFHCESCTPVLAVQADGKDHAVAVFGVDVLNVALVDEHTIRFLGKKSGKLAFDQIDTVSFDGRTLTVKETDYPMNGQQPATSKTICKREGTLPAGVHAASGRWIAVKASGSENGVRTTYKVDGNVVNMSDLTGDSYTAKLDGSDAPVNGAYGWDAVSLKLINDHTIEETDKFNGKVIDVSKMTVSANGKTMTAATTAKPSERTTVVTLTKQ
jgi:hypothetical protein